MAINRCLLQNERKRVLMGLPFGYFDGWVKIGVDYLFPAFTTSEHLGKPLIAKDILW